MTQLMQLVIGANDTAGYPGAFVTIAGAALNHFAKGVVERDPVGRTLMKALHAAAEMELLWPKYRPGSGDHQRIGSPGKTREKYHADRPSAAVRGSDRRRAPAGH